MPRTGDILRAPASWLRSGLNALAPHKDGVAAFQGLATIVAVLAAGIWTIMLTSVYRETKPKVDVEHRIVQRALPAQRKIVLIVDVEASNTGKVLFKEESLFIFISKVFPIANASVLEGAGNGILGAEGHLLPKEWPRIDQETLPLEGRVLEPGEHEAHTFNFVIDDAIKMVQIYTFFRDEERSQPSWFVQFKDWRDGNPGRDHAVGWERLSTYDLEASCIPGKDIKAAPRSN